MQIFLWSVLIYMVTSELLQVQVIIRHGDRAPIMKFTSEDYERVFFRGLGELSDEGILNAHKQGKAFRDRYESFGIIDRSTEPNDIFVRSSPIKRVLMSASSFSSALLDRSVDSDIRPTIHTSNSVDNEQVMLIHDSPDFECTVAKKHGIPGCNTGIILHLLVKASPYCTEFFFPDIEAGIAEIENSEVDMTPSLAECIIKNGRNIQYKNIEMSTGVDEEFNIIRLREVIGQMVTVLEKDIYNIQSKVQDEKKLKVYYTHDEIVLSLAEALGIVKEFNQRNPEFSSAIILETWNSQNGTEIRVLQKDGLHNDFRSVINFTSINHFTDRILPYKPVNKTVIQWKSDTIYTHEQFLQDLAWNDEGKVLIRIIQGFAIIVCLMVIGYTILNNRYSLKEDNVLETIPSEKSPLNNNQRV